jgi:lysophospholipid acyltransferase (LPLAT)-like uncharacterized protein
MYAATTKDLPLGRGNAADGRFSVACSDSMMSFKTLRKKLIARFGPWMAYWTIRALGSTMRFVEVNPEIPKSFLEKGTLAIGAFWHGRLLMIPRLESIHRNTGRKMSFLVSPHRDGQIIGKAVERFGHRAILGSTTRRGFSAFHRMLKAQKEGYDIIVVPDGPRGPRHQVQIGVIELAKLTRCPIVPLSFSASRRKIFNTWDHFLLPYPFSKGVFIWGEPVYVESHGDRVHLEEKRALLEKRLNEITEIADHYFDSPPKA